jgi:ERCC4-related helicase
MYSQYLQDYIEELSKFAEVDSSKVELLQDSMRLFVQILARRLGGINDPVTNLLDNSLQLLAISHAISGLGFEKQIDGGHYLVAVGLEQAGKLLARSQSIVQSENSLPLDNDHWYRLGLAFLHYMAGGHRIQAKAILNYLETISNEIRTGNPESQYPVASNALKSLYEGRPPATPSNLWEQLLFSDNAPDDLQQKRIHKLAKIISQRQRYTLDLLGQDNEEIWLRARNLDSNSAREFWENYLFSLQRRGFTTFTDEQIGENGFDDWLRLEKDLLVVLPTGSGKTLIAELRTALSLAQGKQVVWILPTRPLVRQAKRNLRSAFTGMDVSVEELPITEDFIPYQFAESLPKRRYIAVTTPERLASLIRTRKEVLDNIGLVVVDEAQILFDSNRGAAIEHVVQEMQRLVRDFRLILMSAMSEDMDKFRLFLRRLRLEIPLAELISNKRPTRHMYGVITDDSGQENRQLSILLYPPGLQTENGITERPYSIHFPSNLPVRSNSLSVANLIAQKLSSKDFMTVMFVYQKAWTESNAEKMADVFAETITLPPSDLARIRIELGRDSIIERTGVKKVAPHHAGLTTLEQHIVEKWVKSKKVNTVVATSTLAQGVDLPFDFSILSFTSRFIPGNKASTPLGYSEIKNMMGRAGRAGLVSDGVCLISVMSENNSAKQTLDNSRRYFFHRQEQTKDFIGLSRLMASATKASINQNEWLYELGELSFADSQTLISFALTASENTDEIRGAIIDRLLLYPSIQDLQEILGNGLNVAEVLTSHLEPLVLNIRAATNNDRTLLDAIKLTGMPLEILASFIQRLRDLESVESLGSDLQKATWADEVVKSSIATCVNRAWYKSFFGDLNLDGTFLAISNWRIGLPLSNIEQNWTLKNSERDNRIAVGEFFNHKLSLIAQFWGAISVCVNLLYPNQNTGFEYFQTFTREGVSSVREMEWLEALGGIDRVLAHFLAQNTPVEILDDDMREYARSSLRRWNENRLSIPNELSQYVGALVSVFDDLQR